jgi:hypothetical protein
MVGANADGETVHSAAWAFSYCFKRKIPSIAPLDRFHVGPERLFNQTSAPCTR